MFSFDSKINAGRYGTKSYTLARLLDLRRSLLNGVDQASPITILPVSGSMEEACALVSALVRGNVTEKGLLKAIESVNAEQILINLETIASQEAPVVVNGNSRALAVLLNKALGGDPITLATITYEGDDPRLASFKANAAALLTLKMDWKARTNAVIEYVRQDPMASEASIGKRFDLKRGLAQHAHASALAVITHDLDLERCQSLNPAQWRDVKGATDKAAAEALAYGKVAADKAWSPRQAAAKALENGVYNKRHEELLNILATGTVEQFGEFLK